MTEGVKAFDQSFVTLTNALEEKARSLKGSGGASGLPGLFIQDKRFLEEAATLKSDWQRDRVLERLLAEDPSLFQGDSEKNAKAMGFLSDIDRLTERRSEFLAAGEEIRTKKIRTILWLGMGGSILSTLALAESISDPDVCILGVDTTDPETIVRLAEEAGLGGEGGAPPPLRIVVSSQSGSTLEVSSLYSYFRALLEKKEYGQQENISGR